MNDEFDAFDTDYWFDDFYVYGDDNDNQFVKDFDTMLLDPVVLKPPEKSDSVQNNKTFNSGIFSNQTPTEFRENYNQHFTGRKNKPARKELILRYHQMITMKYPKIIRPTKREEQRDISKYFVAFSKYASLIIQTIIELENECMINYKEEHRALIISKKKVCF